MGQEQVLYVCMVVVVLVRYLGYYHNDGSPDQGGGDKYCEKWSFAYDLRVKWEGLLVGWQCSGRRK